MEGESVQQVARTVVAGLQDEVKRWQGPKEGIQGFVDALAIANGTHALVELFRPADQSRQCGSNGCPAELLNLNEATRAALYDALPLCALEDRDWINDHHCSGRLMKKWGCRIRTRRANEGAASSHIQSAQSLWGIIRQESNANLRRSAAASFGQMDEKHGLLLKTVLDSIEAENGQRAQSTKHSEHVFPLMLPYLASQTRTSTSERWQIFRENEHERLHRLLAFRFPEFEAEFSFTWTEFSVTLGLCAPRQAALSIGDEWIGFHIYIEICDQARAWIPYFGAPGYEITIKNEVLVEITALQKSFTLLRIFLGQEGGPQVEAAAARHILPQDAIPDSPRLTHAAADPLQLDSNRSSVSTEAHTDTNRCTFLFATCTY